ncbi:mechanosensitive ion channel family protein [Devosia sp.]|uniref:mechanosensitive ion channel family protein n=1 Tax=Devosia sp. TaxID=1871048 RepID=UPI003A90C874
MNDLEAAITQAIRVLDFLPDWLISLIIVGASIVVAIIVHRLVFSVMTRMVANRDMFWRSLVKRTRLSTRLAVIVIFVSGASLVAPLTEMQAGFIRHAVVISLIALAVLAARTVLHIWMTLYLRQFSLDSEDNLLARKHLTQSRILERIAVTLFVVVGIAAALMTFDGVAQWGVSLLASAGAAGLVVGLALQPLLKNIFAGLQLAITQPIRIDDALLVEGEWGNVEEITSTYVVVKIWDWRRLILPLSYFIEQPFQNWTREGAALIGVVTIYLDYTTPVEAVRAKVKEIAEASPLWEGGVVAVQVTDFKEFTMEVRILISARNAGRAFDLRCEMREKLVAFLQAEYPASLPRLRSLNEDGGGPPGEGAHPRPDMVSG